MAPQLEVKFGILSVDRKGEFRLDSQIKVNGESVYSHFSNLPDESFAFTVYRSDLSVYIEDDSVINQFSYETLKGVLKILGFDLDEYLQDNAKAFLSMAEKAEEGKYLVELDFKRN